jgi:hypothetical protein
MTGLRIVDVPTTAPRDPQRATVRYLRLDTFRGLPIPGEPVELRMPHTRRTIPGVIHFVHWFDGVVAVEPDMQTIHGTR